MADAHVSTKRPDGHSILPNGKLTALRRMMNTLQLDLAADDWSITLEFHEADATLLRAGLELLYTNPRVYEIRA